MRRVVITGMGAVTSLAHNAPQSWAKLITGASGLKKYINDPILRNKDKEYVLGLVQDFDFGKWKVPYATSRMTSFLRAAATEALKDSGLNIGQIKQNTGVNIGCMSSNISKLTQHIDEVAKLDGAYDKINRLSMLQILANIPAATLVTEHGFRGPSGSSSTACATGLSAIGEAFRWIQLGDAEYAVAGGVEDVYNPTCLYSSIKLQAMTTKQWPSASQSSRPFDKNRSGFVLGEGAGVVVLEALQSALNRNAKIYGQVLAFGCTSDGYHLTRPLESGDGALRAMQKCLRQAGLKVEDIDHISCHATSTQVGDEAEVKAIKQLLGSHVKKVSLSATKSNLGHTFGAAGSIQLILALQMMLHKQVPGILNLHDPIDKDLWLPTEPVGQEIKVLLKNALGFGGVNTSILIKNARST